ncbi:Uncharacterized protein Fot_10089 [Forsythia ovata]|uniref:Uncharacterized protein n=1 Tax=Forsythia ovata TaxID=205694 RepID=A0ABD1WFU0_9LAMI
MAQFLSGNEKNLVPTVQSIATTFVIAIAHYVTTKNQNGAKRSSHLFWGSIAVTCVAAIRRTKRRQNFLSSSSPIATTPGGGTGQLSGGRKSISRTSRHSGAARASGGLKYL